LSHGRIQDAFRLMLFNTFARVTTLSTAADFKGFVEDTLCSTISGMNNDAQCAQKCIKAGKDAVLVGDDGKIYKIADQSKIVAHAGHSVTITGELKGDTISVASMKLVI
jgi:hypothetical protein